MKKLKMIVALLIVTLIMFGCTKQEDLPTPITIETINTVTVGDSNLLFRLLPTKFYKIDTLTNDSLLIVSANCQRITYSISNGIQTQVSIQEEQETEHRYYKNMYYEIDVCANGTMYTALGTGPVCEITGLYFDLCSYGIYDITFQSSSRIVLEHRLNSYDIYYHYDKLPL